MTPNRLRVLPIAIAVLALFLWWRQGNLSYEQVSPDTAATVPSASAESATEPTSTQSRYGQRGFRNRERLLEHFEKHGAEFGATTPEAYLLMAQQLRDAPLGSDILEDTRKADKVISRFQKSSGAFLAFDSDGTIRTFFRPNDGERYYRRQLTRPPL